MTASHPAPATDDAIRAVGLRVTDSRRAVFDALRDHPHAKADDVLDRVLLTVPGTSLQSVYNALSDFAEAGLVRRIEPAGHPGLFELRVERQPPSPRSAPSAARSRTSTAWSGRLPA